VSIDLQAAFAEHRSALLRHCYRMLGSYAEAEDLVQDAFERAWQARDGYRGEASPRRWLFTIATNACLNALARRRPRSLPELEAAAAAPHFELPAREPERFITPAADARLFPGPEEQSEARETLTLAFVALLSRVPPRQRAALLLKDVLGWSAEEIATALEMTLPAVNSALQRARETIARPTPAHAEPPSSTLQSFVQAWETRDLDALVGLLRADITLSMPPWAVWLRGVDDVVSFFQSPRFSVFWSGGVRLLPTRANTRPAFGFYRRAGGGLFEPHSLMVASFVDSRAAGLTVFVGNDFPAQLGLPAKIEAAL
jgi:RNA polymerase sigma-70 factor, ECF subfamily